jgi:hypothetical protein
LELPEEGLQERFDALDEALTLLWKSISQLSQEAAADRRRAVSLA